jgi:hypothetical protein
VPRWTQVLPANPAAPSCADHMSLAYSPRFVTLGAGRGGSCQQREIAEYRSSRNCAPAFWRSITLGDAGGRCGLQQGPPAGCAHRVGTNIQVLRGRPDRWPHPATRLTPCFDSSIDGLSKLDTDDTDSIFTRARWVLGQFCHVIGVPRQNDNSPGLSEGNCRHKRIKGIAVSI